MTGAALWVFPLLFLLARYVLVPLIRGRGDVGEDAGRQQKQARRQEILQELADVDLDFKIGRIEADDLARIKAEKADQLARLG